MWKPLTVLVLGLAIVAQAQSAGFSLRAPAVCASGAVITVSVLFKAPIAKPALMQASSDWFEVPGEFQVPTGASQVDFKARAAKVTDDDPESTSGTITVSDGKSSRTVDIDILPGE